MNIVEHIWSNTLELRDPTNLPPLGSILASLLASPMICFTTKETRTGARPVVSYAGDEVLPSASLADVLFEEFGIEICDRTIVLIEPSEIGGVHTMSSQDLGQALGQVLVDLSQLNQTDNPAMISRRNAEISQQNTPSSNQPELMNLVQ